MSITTVTPREAELMAKLAAQRKVLEQALEALNNSIDLVNEEYTEAVRKYGQYPARKGKLDGLKALANEHQSAITAIQGALA